MHSRFYYKRPGAWLWKLHSTEALAAEVASGQLSRAGRFRLENTAADIPLEQLLCVQPATQNELRSAMVAAQASDGVSFFQLGTGFLVGGMVSLLAALVVEGTGWSDALVVGVVGGLVVGGIGAFCSQRGFEFLVSLISS